MTTATQPRISGYLKSDVRTAIRDRDSALADLRRMPAHLAGTDWQYDRVAEVEMHNRFIERAAARHGIGPAELIELSAK